LSVVSVMNTADTRRELRATFYSSRVLTKHPAPEPEPVPVPAGLFLATKGYPSPCPAGYGVGRMAAEAVYGECATSLAMRRRL
jgi:hypothetical protein